MSEKKEVKIENFRQYLARKLLPYKAREPKESWNRRNRGEGMFPGKNQEKRARRAAHALDRLAHIRWTNGMHGNGGRTPKLKRVPAYVFE